MTPTPQAVEEALKVADYQPTSNPVLAGHMVVLAAEVRRLRANIETMNARVGEDAKSYERDQYLIGKLREQLAALSRARGIQSLGSKEDGGSNEKTTH